MHSSTLSAVLFATLLGSTLGLVTRPVKDCTSLVQRGDPADSKTIEGDDCGNVQQIIGKWAKSTKAGTLNGAAQAAANTADQTAKNTDDARKRAEALGLKVGLGGKMPKAVKSAAADAEKASKGASAAATKLRTTSKTFKGNFANFATKITDDDIIKIKKETKAAIVASEDANDAADRVTEKAAEAKDQAMKSSAGALKLISGLLADMNALSTQVGTVNQKSDHAGNDIDALVTKSKKATKVIDGKIKVAKEQAPVWQAYKDDLAGRTKAARTSKMEVGDAMTALKKAVKDMDGKAKALQATVDKSQSDQNALLGQAENISDAEASIRKSQKAFDVMKDKVTSMNEDGERLTDKLEETYDRLGN